MRCDFPDTFVDISHLHEVSNSQEVFNEGDTDSVFIVDIVEHASEVRDDQAAAYYFADNADLNQAKTYQVNPASNATIGNSSKMFVVQGDQTGVVKGREHDPEGNTIRVFCGVVRLPQYNADVVVTMTCPLWLSAVNAARAKQQPLKSATLAETQFLHACSTLEIVDNSLFA